MAYRLSKTPRLYEIAVAALVLVAVVTAGAQTGTTGNQFSIVVLPDTQDYSSSTYSAGFNQMMSWIVNDKNWNIKAVIGEGDITNDGSSSSYWSYANTAFNYLDGHLPYVLAIGNHDYDNQNPSTRQVTGYDGNFAIPRYVDRACCGWIKANWPVLTQPTYRNLYGEVSIPMSGYPAPGKRFIILALEFYPPDSVLVGTGGSATTAEQVIFNNPDAELIVTTHAFILPDSYDADGNGTRVASCEDAAGYGVGSDNGGEEMWTKVLSKYANVSLVVNGHFWNGTSVYANNRRDLGLSGNLVNQMAADYQGFYGQEWLRILTFDPDVNRIYVRTYSPKYGSFMTDAKSQFDVPWHMTNSISSGVARIEGWVHRPDCSGVAGALVTVLNTSPLLSGITDSSGHFDLSDVPTGTTAINLYTMQVEGSGIQTTQRQVNAYAEFPAYLKITVSPAPIATGRIAGTVTSSSTRLPIAKAAVRVSGPATVKTTTASDGTYSTGQIPIGTYTVTVSKPRYITATVNVVVSKDAIAPGDVVLSPRK